MMYTTRLRKVGGSVMLAVPPALLDVLHLSAGANVGLAVDSGRLLVEPSARPRYTLDEVPAKLAVKEYRKVTEARYIQKDTATGDLFSQVLGKPI